jgi:hypothetical protein
VNRGTAVAIGIDHGVCETNDRFDGDASMLVLEITMRWD